MSCVLFTVFLYVGEGNYQQATKEFLLQGAVDLEVDKYLSKGVAEWMTVYPQ